VRTAARDRTGSGPALLSSGLRETDSCARQVHRRASFRQFLDTTSTVHPVEDSGGFSMIARSDEVTAVLELNLGRRLLET